MDGTLQEVSGLLSKREVRMNDEYRQQALDNFRNALGRLEQSDFEIRISDGDHKQGIWIYVKDALLFPDNVSIFTTISNHILRLIRKK